MKEFFKKIWEKIKTWFLKKWNQFKTWFINKPLPWLKENWMIIGCYAVIFISYSIIYGHDDVVWAETLLGLWMFASVAYGAFKLFMKDTKKSVAEEPVAKESAVKKSAPKNKK